MFPFQYAVFAALLGLAWAQSTVNTITQTFVGSNGVTTVPWPPSCTALDTRTSAVYDSNAQELYYFMCGAATNNPGLATFGANTTWRDCFARCDNTAGCTSFSFNNAANGINFGETSGDCVLKAAAPPAFSQTDTLQSTRIGVIRYRFVNTATIGTTTSATTTTSSSSSSSTFPTTTTSITTTTTTGLTATVTATTLSTVYGTTTATSVRTVVSTASVTQTQSVTQSVTQTQSVTGTQTLTTTSLGTATQTQSLTASITTTQSVTGPTQTLTTSVGTASVTTTQSLTAVGTSSTPIDIRLTTLDTERDWADSDLDNN
ncbi:hypothetical protein BDZ85DRAFT_105362 [Elsinoe ampelina]|uniref:Apple domain-containing protein n=1 Tax=Elsinoe ampelina TaxID=302913 RepID=A0A6A6FY92_9PEZI|nr:hypothetical protein BDZ85DRAFT_105362 [Elsinoe ampelina]